MKRFIRIACLAFLLPAFLAPAGFGQVLPVPLAVSLEARDFFTPFRGGSRSTVAALPGGGFATVWNRHGFDSRFSDVYLQFVHPDGSLVFERRGRAVAALRAFETDAVVATHAQEGALVAWRVDRSRQLNSSQMMFQWIDGQGRSRWKAGVAAAPASRDEFQSIPALLASPDGGAFVCFIHTVIRTAIVTSIDCQRFSSKGKRLWGKNGVRVFTGSQNTEGPHLVADGAGGVLVFWRAGAEGGVSSGAGSIRGQRLGPTGRPLWGGGAEGRIVYETLSPSSNYPREIGVVPDGTGGVFVAFDDGIFGIELKVLRVSGAGERLWENEIPDASSLHSLVSGPDGGVFVGVYDGSKNGVTFHRFSADGTSLWPAGGVPVVDPSTVSPGDVNWLTYATFDGNELRFAWEHISGASALKEIRFGALDLAGNRLSGPAGVTLTEEQGSHDIGGLAFDPESGVSFVIWHTLKPHGEVGDSDALGAIIASP